MICNIQQASFKCVVIQFRTRINATIITTIYTLYATTSSTTKSKYSTIQCCIVREFLFGPTTDYRRRGERVVCYQIHSFHTCAQHTPPTHRHLRCLSKSSRSVIPPALVFACFTIYRPFSITLLSFFSRRRCVPSQVKSSQDK